MLSFVGKSISPVYFIKQFEGRAGWHHSLAVGEIMAGIVGSRKTYGLEVMQHCAVLRGIGLPTENGVFPPVSNCMYLTNI